MSGFRASSEPSRGSEQSSRERVIELYERHQGAGQARLSNTMNLPVEVSSDGVWIHTSDGRNLMNCGGYGVFFLGAGNPYVVNAVQTQIERLALSTRVLLNEAAATAAETLTRVAPTGLEKVYFCNSGAEAVEAAIKLARANGKNRLVAMANGYHGKTMGALSIIGRSLYRDPFVPLLPDVRRVPFGDLGELRAVVDAETCVILEPVQSEGGVIIPWAGYLKGVRQICDEAGALLVLDEIMTGLGRLGSWWGADQEDVSPDILLVGKALSGGVVPVAATLATREVFAPLDADPYLHTSTYSAAPIAMAAVRATVECIEQNDLVSRAAVLGRSLLEGITQAVSDLIPHLVADVRGAGLLIGIEYNAPMYAGEFLIEAPDHGLIVNHSMNTQSVVRFTPPAILTDAEAEELIGRVRLTCSALAEQHPASAVS